MLKVRMDHPYLGHLGLHGFEINSSELDASYLSSKDSKHRLVNKIHCILLHFFLLSSNCHPTRRPGLYFPKHILILYFLELWPTLLISLRSLQLNPRRMIHHGCCDLHKPGFGSFVIFSIHLVKIVFINFKKELICLEASFMAAIPEPVVSLLTFF